jgi:hypothetical protein
MVSPWRTTTARWRARMKPSSSAATWGSADLIHWINDDEHRSGKRDAFIIQLTGSIRPVITPDHPDEVTAELTAHGVNVTSG